MSIPQRHVYVRHITPVGTPPPWHCLPDPPARPWWPPERLDPAWITENAHRFDVFHVHFGFDGQHPSALQDVCDTLRHHDKPLVYTAHDLRNPHHPEPGLHREQMAVWTANADEVLTLTRGAASALHAWFGVTATVVAHPHVVPLDQIARRRRRRQPRSGLPRVGLHLKSLRPNMAALPVLDVIPDLVAQVRCEVRIDVHRDVVVAGGANHDPAVAAALDALQRRRRITVAVHDYYDDDAFLDYLASLDVSLLPYRFGTHSGWLEACRDLAVTTAAADCGHYREQGATATFVCNEVDGLRADTLIAAVEASLRNTTPPVTVAARRAQRDAVAAVHARLYRALHRRAAMAATP